jgi:hypothetical protein
LLTPLDQLQRQPHLALHLQIEEPKCTVAAPAIAASAAAFCGDRPVQPHSWDPSLFAASLPTRRRCSRAIPRKEGGTNGHTQSRPGRRLPDLAGAGSGGREEATPTELYLRRRQGHPWRRGPPSSKSRKIHGRACEVKAVVDLPQVCSTRPATTAACPRAPPHAALLLAVEASYVPRAAVLRLASAAGPAPARRPCLQLEREPELEPIRGRAGASPWPAPDPASTKARADETEAARGKEERRPEDLRRSR